MVKGVRWVRAVGQKVLVQLGPGLPPTEGLGWGALPLRLCTARPNCSCPHPRDQSQAEVGAQGPCWSTNAAATGRPFLTHKTTVIHSCCLSYQLNTHSQRHTSSPSRHQGTPIGPPTHGGHNPYPAFPPILVTNRCRCLYARRPIPPPPPKDSAGAKGGGVRWGGA